LWSAAQESYPEKLVLFDSVLIFNMRVTEYLESVRGCKHRGPIIRRVPFFSELFLPAGARQSVYASHGRQLGVSTKVQTGAGQLFPRIRSVSRVKAGIGSIKHATPSH
jgi:hypothetical protein